MHSTTGSDVSASIHAGAIENVEWVGPRFGANIMLDRSIDLPFTNEELDQLSHLGPAGIGVSANACAVNGVGAEQAAAVQADFREMLDVLSAHFAHNRFLLGGRPCLADFALAGEQGALYYRSRQKLAETA